MTTSTSTETHSLLVESKKQAYKKDIQSLSTSYQALCVKCHGNPDNGFKQHDRWRRSFRFVVDGFVYIFIGLLVRWKCPICHKTFTMLPSFAAPRKRYVIETILEKSEAYINDPKCSTRRAVYHERLPIGYAPFESGKIDDRQLAHSTLWRWTEWLGNQRPLLETAESLIRQHAPLQTYYREIIPIAPSKYRSEKRKQTLESASILIRISRIFKHLFSRQLFPRFATGP